MRARVMIMLMLVGAATVVLVGCGSDDEQLSSDDSSSTGTTTSADIDAPEGDDDHDAPRQFEIEISEPPTFSSVHGSFRLAGTASVFEGALVWQILGEDLKPIKRGTMTASCGAPCRGKYSTTVNLQGVKPGSWELHVFAPPVDANDPPRLHDTILPITVTTGPVGDAPAADASPPGGAPNT